MQYSEFFFFALGKDSKYDLAMILVEAIEEVYSSEITLFNVCYAMSTSAMIVPNYPQAFIFCSF